MTAGRAACAVLQLYDRRAEVVRIAAQHGFTSEFVVFFAAVDAAAPTGCATVLATCRPVVVNDVTRSALVTGQPTVEFRLGAGYEWLSDEQIAKVIECTTHALDRFLVMKLRLTCDHSSWRTSP